MDNDLISREALKNVILADRMLDGKNANWEVNRILVHISNAPTVEAYTEEQVKELVELNKKLSEARPQGEWIPVSEKLPEDETEVLIQHSKSIMLGYHKFDPSEYPPEFKDENETGWYDNEDDFICGSDEVIAWMPLPEPYKKGGAE